MSAYYSLYLNMDEKEIVADMFNYIAMFRGVFINKMSYIERVFEMVIADHYCKKDLHIEFIDHLLSESYVPFEGKKVAFKNILQTNHPRVFENSKNMFDNIQFFQPHRNKIAHYIVCTTDEAIEKYKEKKEFGLLQYYERTQPIWYSVELQNKISQAVDEVFEWCKINDEIDNPPS